jgi:hypothetical protein
MSGGVVLVLLVYLGGLIYASVIAVKKGKTTMMILGWLFFSPLIVIAACRIAKPTSDWARERYQFDPLKATLSKTRFPKEAIIVKYLADETATPAVQPATPAVQPTQFVT